MIVDNVPIEPKWEKEMIDSYPGTLKITYLRGALGKTKLMLTYKFCYTVIVLQKNIITEKMLVLDNLNPKGHKSQSKKKFVTFQNQFHLF